ncbi:MAG: hypothetical protein AB7T49_11250 [Oligoflexales bacterium]
MRMRPWVVAFVLFQMTTKLFAGSWSSGGGAFYTDEYNPWFIQNTKIVKYCITIDDEHFGVGLDKVRTNIVEAIKYWKEEFKELEILQQYSSPVQLATADFREVNCKDDSVRVVFQMGVIDGKKQRRYIESPEKTVGVAVRTSYDPVNLRGKGFIYISPEEGKYALKGKDLIAKRWQQNGGKLLQLILIHELGHVFGIPHHGSWYEIMGEQFPNSLVNDYLGAYYAARTKVPHFFTVPKQFAFESCSPAGVGERAAAVLGMRKETNCIKIQSDSETKVLSRSESDALYGLSGTFRTYEETADKEDFGTLHLSPRQKALSDLPPGTSEITMFQTATFKLSGAYTDLEGNVTPVVLEYGPKGLTMQGMSGTNPGLILLNVVSFESWQIESSGDKRYEGVALEDLAPPQPF